MSRVRTSRVSLLALLFLGFLAWTKPSSAQSGVSYVYDQLGRLIGVIDSSGDAAAYSYDAVGNLLSILRYTASQISLINFSPTSGPVGTTVTISGTGFSSTLSQDTVKFGGTTATLVSATTNQIVAVVPTGASTGQIQVTSPAGTVTSSTNFVVTTGNGAPTISSISPTAAAPGTSISVTGTNFSSSASSDILRFNVTPQSVSSASSTSLSAILPAPTSSGHITVATASGAAVSSQDLYIPFGTHTVSDIGDALRTTIGTSTTLSIGTTGQIGLALFDGAAGEKISIVEASQSGFNSTSTINLISPTGNVLYSNELYSAIFPILITLPATGTYTVGVDPNGTGTVTFTVYNASDAAGSVTPGGSPITVTTTLPGQDARIRFSGTSGQQIYVQISNVTTADAWVYLIRPDGAYQAQAAGLGGFIPPTDAVQIGPTSPGQFYYLDTTILEQSGTYTIWVQHAGNNYGSEQIYVGNAPTSVTGTIAVDGASVSVTTTTAWQSAELTFSGTTGQDVFLEATNISTQNGYVNLIAPDGSVIEWVAFTAISGTQNYYAWLSLPMSGTYTYWVQNDGTDTGTETLELYSVPSPAGSISTDGTPVTASTSSPGQNEVFSFNGTTGQRLFLVISDISTPDAFVWILDDSTGQPYSAASTEINAGLGYWYELSPYTLPNSGTYYVYVQHSGSYTGSETLQLYDVTNNVTGTVAAGGSPVTVSTTIPGQWATVTFSGTTGESIYLTLTDVTLLDAYVDLIAPDGTDLGWIWTGSDYSSSYQFGPGTLPQTGTYTWYIYNYSPATGSETLQLYNPPANVTGTISVGGSPVTVTTTAVGQAAAVTFSGTASQSVTLTVSSVSNSGAWIDLEDSGGNYVDSVYVYGSGSSTFTMGPDTLPSTGTYTLWVQPVGTNYGSETLQLN